MANKSYYHRSFVILRAEEEDFGILPHKDPTGYCKFEIRREIGKAHIYLQDIKPSSILEGVYEAYMVSAEDSISPCKLASLYVDEHGRSEHIVSFDAKDVMGTGHSLERFHVLVVAFNFGTKDGSTRMAYPLIGYVSRDVRMDKHDITKVLAAMLRKDIKVVAQPEVMIQEETGIITKNEARTIEKPEQDIMPQVTELSEGIIEAELDTISQASEAPRGETAPNLPVAPITDPAFEPTRQIETDPEKPGDRLRKAYEDSYKRYLKEMDPPERSFPSPAASYWENVKDYFADLFKNHQKVSPFNNGFGNAEWIRVQQTAQMPWGYNSESVHQYPYYYGSYLNHYIVGIVKDEEKAKYVIHGVPSTYSMMPPTALNGFSRWVPAKEGYGMGYWLLYIDASSGRIIYPDEKE
ncbi:MAG: hypothetical protein GX352_08175 [Clostridiales bacterium]|nr:hypothetical protein [Clostridiales bacterium]